MFLSVISNDIARMHTDQILTSISADMYNSQVTWLLIPNYTQTHCCVSLFYGWLGEKEKERRKHYVISWFCKSIWNGQIAQKCTANSLCWTSITLAGCEAKSYYLRCHMAERWHAVFRQGLCICIAKWVYTVYLEIEPSADDVPQHTSKNRRLAADTIAWEITIFKIKRIWTA